MKKIIKKKIKSNENGFMDLVFVMILAAVMVGIMAQIIVNQSSLNQVHRSNKERSLIQHKLKSLALKFKESKIQADVSVCSGSNTVLTKNGGNFCLPSGDSMCINMTEVIGTTQVIKQVCTSLRNVDLSWDDALVSSASLDTIATPVGTGVRNRINTPAVTNDLWKSCAAGVCLRILLCDESVTSCTLDDAVAYQIVRF